MTAAHLAATQKKRYRTIRFPASLWFSIVLSVFFHGTLAMFLSGRRYGFNLRTIQKVHKNIFLVASH